MLEHYGIHTAFTPPGGWHYMQPLADGSLFRIPAKHGAMTDADLVRMVTLFRAQNRIDQGDVGWDVANYIRTNFPRHDRTTRNPEALPKRRHKPGFRPLIEKIADWLRFEVTGNPKLLIEDEADARAEICAACPNNVQWKTLCVPCVEDVAMRAMNLRQRAIYKHDDKLRGCRLHALHLGAAVFIDREALPPVNGDAPSACWLHPHASPHLSPPPSLPAVPPSPEAGA